MQLPDTVESIKTVDEMSGHYIEITFKNGAVVWVSAENDAMHYFTKKDFANEYETTPTCSMLVDFDAGHHDGRESDVTVIRGKNCTRFDVNKC